MNVNDELGAYLRSREVGESVLKGIEQLLAQDAYLLRVDANERAITHRLAMHLQVLWPQMHVDCEYNRDGIEPKRIGHLQMHPDIEDTDGRTVFRTPSCIGAGSGGRTIWSSK